MDDRVRPQDNDSPQRDLKVRAAWFYYVEGLTQEQIASAMSISRAKVVRLLFAARNEGIVRIRIDAQDAERVALERGLVARYGVAEAIVVPAHGDDDAQVAAAIGHAAAVYLRGELRDGLSLAVGWGTTLTMMVRALGRPGGRVGSVVSLLGGMTHSRAVNPAAVARRLADVLKADCYQLTAPLIVADEATRAALWAERGLRELRERARRADLALVSVGDASESATLFREELVPRAQLASLRAAGAVGDVLCQFVDAQGRVVDHPLNRHVLAVDLADLRDVRRIVIASGGARKVEALRAALKALPAGVLITDESAAAGLLA
jgi:DNA-binding transcriptional regulator LsrR (DeoR family)